MAPDRLFIDADTDGLDVDQLLYETKPIALLLFVFGGVGVVFLVLTDMTNHGSLFHRLFSLAAEFVFTLGGFVAALYVLVRALQLTGNFDGRPDSVDADSPGGPDSRLEIPVRDGSSGRVSRVRSDASADDADREDEGERESEDEDENEGESENENRERNDDTEDGDGTDGRQ